MPETLVAPRIALLRSMFDSEGVGLEIGPLNNPVAPKREGFQVEILDHATTAELQAKYRDDPRVNTEVIEDVDIVSDGRPLRDLLYGRRYDWIVASHVIEHMPDPIGFLTDCEGLLRPGGRLVLAVPDRRKCFDALRPVSTLGGMLEAHTERRSRHSPGALFDAVAYAATLAGRHDWSDYDSGTPDLVGTPARGLALFDAACSGDAYIDAHGWVFTPASFRLILFDLLAIGRTELKEISFSDSPGCEFFMSLGTDGAGCPAERRDLVRSMMAEAGPRASTNEDVLPLRSQIERMQRELETARQESAQLHERIRALETSTSWRLTAPLRAGRQIWRRALPRTRPV